MDAQYIAVYEVQGCKRLESKPHLSLDEDPKITLTNDPEPFCLHIDRYNAIQASLLKSFLGGSKKHGSAKDRLEWEYQEAQKRRRNSQSESLFLVVEASLRLTAKLTHMEMLENFGFCLDAVPSDSFRRTAERNTRAAASALSITLPGTADKRLTKVGSASYLLDQERLPIYSFCIEFGSPSLWLKSQLPEELGEVIKERYHSIMERDRLSNVVTLLSKSRQAETDELSSFIGAWAAIEMFVHNAFNDDKYLEELLRIVHNEGILIASQKIRKVLRSDHRLNEKFKIIACVLDPTNARTDIRKFQRLKDFRNSLYHGEIADWKTLPTLQIFELLDRYLALALSVGPSDAR